ncbi:MAG: hypothetical protein Q4F18_03400 [Clostridia bacterium]|nr:hypothetical protein [Clostridia bacterium]
MIDEFFERKVDEWCERVPAALKPRLIRLANSSVGWRIYLYAASAGRSIAGAFGHIRSEDDMDVFMRETAERGDEGIAWLKRFARRRKAMLARMDDALRRGRFAAVLYLLILSVLGVCARGTRPMAVMAMSLCVLWLATAVDAGYEPVCGGIRQRYLFSALARVASVSLLLLSYFDSYLRQGVPSNVVLQSAMIVTLVIHATLQLALVVFNTRQPLLLRALAAIAGTAPALTAAAAIALAASLVARTWPLPAAGVMSAAGAVLAFLGEELVSIVHLGGIRLKYGSIWMSLFTLGGFALMLAGAWNL